MVFKVLKYIKKHLLLFLLIEIFLAIGISRIINVSENILKSIVLPIIYLMIIPSMICLDLKKVLRIKEYNLIFFSLFINFVIFPLVAYIIFLFTNNFYLFVSLLLLSLLPTGPMTLNFVSLLDGNVHTAAAIQIICLIIGSLLIPISIHMLDNTNVSILDVFYKVIIVLFIPLIIGQILRYLIGITKVESNKENIRLIGMSGC